MLGRMTYQAMPARRFVDDPTPVSSAPHSAPAAKLTCCMRVSFESSIWSFSLCAGSSDGSNRYCQQPGPNGVGSFVLLRHVSSGVEPGRCFEDGGTPYCATSTIALRSATFGCVESREAVLVRPQTPIR